MPTMRTERRAFWAPKAGQEAADYEDAHAVRAGDGPVRAAVADGATESAFARPWAEALVEGYVRGGVSGAEALAAHLPAWRRAWEEAVRPRLAGLPWYAAAKADEGAFAALLGLAVDPGGAWHALSVGDACLFHLRDEEVLASWPFEDADAFTNRPALLATRPDVSAPPVAERAGRWRSGDAFLLATDALAAWLLRTDPADARMWDAARFEARVAEGRADGTLRNDDITLLVLEVAR